MKTYRVDFSKVVYGWFEIKAKSKKEAEDKIASEGDEIENKSDYDVEWDTLEEVRA